MHTPLKLGIDLGGSKIEIIALENGQQALRRRAPTPQGDYQKTVSLVASLVEDCERELGRRGSLGVGIPGTRSPDHGRIKNANSQCLIGEDLQADLEQRLQRPVRLANDADCFALSEACDGAGEGAVSVFGVILGTGVGGGLVVRQQLLSGPNAIAGEWGTTHCPGGAVGMARAGAVIAARMTASKPFSAARAGRRAATWAWMQGHW